MCFLFLFTRESKNTYIYVQIYIYVYIYMYPYIFKYTCKCLHVFLLNSRSSWSYHPRFNSFLCCISQESVELFSDALSSFFSHLFFDSGPKSLFLLHFLGFVLSFKLVTESPEGNTEKTIAVGDEDEDPNEGDEYNH